MIEAKKKTNDFKDMLTNAVKDAGQELINMAEDIANDADKNLISKVFISVSLNPEEFTLQLPIISIEKEYLCKAAIDRYNKERGLNNGE